MGPFNKTQVTGMLNLGEHMMRNQHGFTLIEIAIVLVVIGLLLGGIIKGRSFIDSAKMKNVTKQAESLSAAIYGYQDQYSYVPGDDNAANSRWGSATNGNANGRINGQEYRYAPQHLALAGLITGSYDGSTFITHKYGGQIRLTYQNIRGHGANNLIRFDNLPAKAAEALDKALDDGKPDSGAVVINNGDYSNPERAVGQTGYYY